MLVQTSGMDRMLDEVCAVVRRISDARNLGADTRVFHDLSISGDDAWEMLEEIASQFNVSFSAMSFERYFPAEHEALGAHLGKLVRLRSKKEPLTVGHLAAVADRGAWFDPVPNV